MSKLFGLLFLIGLVCLGDTLTKQEAFKVLHDVSANIRVEYMNQWKSAIKDAQLKATPPEQMVCVKRHISSTFKDINVAVTKALLEIKKEYEKKTEEEFESLVKEEEMNRIEGKIRPALSWFPERVEQINSCIKL